MPPTITIRPACPDDQSRLSTMISRSYRALLAADYDPALLRLTLPLLTVPRPQLLRSGTYFVAVDDTGRVLSAGGWTDSRPNGSPGRRGEGHVRHVATDPDHLGRGLGRRVIETAAASARASGIDRLSCQSTLTAERFYSALGFTSCGRVDVRLEPGLYFPSVMMQRSLV